MKTFGDQGAVDYPRTDSTNVFILHQIENKHILMYYIYVYICTYIIMSSSLSMSDCKCIKLMKFHYIENDPLLEHK
jgi:hypothetical protein